MNLKFLAIFIVLVPLNIAHGQEDIRNCLTGFRPTAAKSLQHLEQWVGRYSFDKDPKTGKTFFELPEIRKPLQTLLSKDDFTRLTKVYGTESAMDMYGNYLVVDKCKPHNSPGENALLIINLENGSMNVAFFKMYGSKTETRWVDGNIDHYHLPEEISTLAYLGHTPLLGFIPKSKMPLKDYINESRHCIEKTDYSKALQFIEEGIKYYPDSVRLYVVKSHILSKMGRSEEAYESLKEILKKPSDY